MARRGHLLQIEGADLSFLRAVLHDASVTLRSGATPPPEPASGMPGGLVGLLFFENSTRTRLSFSAAAHALGAGVLDLNAGVSSVSKGESFTDTAFTLEAMGARVLVVRSRAGGVPHAVARGLRRIGSGAVVINAGDGRHEHPTQALIDTLALGERLGRLGDRDRPVDLRGVRVAIVGDLVNSRVARSNTRLMTALGAEVVGCGPEALAPDAFGRALGVPVVRELDTLAGRVDALLMLRVQFERHGPAGAEASGGAPMDASAYRAGFGLSAERLSAFDGALGRPTVVMHPGPMNRGLEIDAGAADAPNSVVRRQVAAGVHVRTALLARGLGR